MDKPPTKFSKLFLFEFTTIPDTLNQSYFPSLDGLRGVAIIMVLLSHFSTGTTLSKYFDGKMGVEIFFVLSGFLITTLLIKEKIKKGKVSLKNFYIRRVLRIVPVAYLFLLVLLLLNHIFKLNITAKNFAVSSLYLGDLPIQVGGEKWYTGHFWTLAVEEQFYIITPWLLVTNVSRYFKVICVIIILAPIMQYLLYNRVGIFDSNHILHSFTIIFVLLFSGGANSILLGSVFSILVFNGSLKKVKIVKNYFFSFILLIIAIILRTEFSEAIHYVKLSSIWFSLIIAYIIILSITSNDFLSAILKSKFLVYIGILSYSIYVWQQIFTHVQPWRGLFPFAGSWLLNLVLLFITAYCSYNFYEKIFLNYKNRFK